MKVQGRLRPRLVRAFLVTASSAVLVSAAALWIVDRSIRAEIDQRGAAVERAVVSAIDERGKDVAAAAARVAADRALSELANDPGLEAALDDADDLAARLSATYRLDLLTLVCRGTIVSSSHLPTSVGDPANLPEKDGHGFGEELVFGNPPTARPAILAAASVTDANGKVVLRVLGGSLVDERLFSPLASAAEAEIVLSSPSGESRFGSTVSGTGHVVKLGSLPGRDPATLEIRVSAERLENARSRLLGTSALFVAFAALLALGLAESRARAITKPIEALSDATAEVAAGRTQVRVSEHADGEVKVLIDGFNSMVEDLAVAKDRIARAERVAAWREAARRIAHEIKNPLFPMRMAMETLRKAHAAKHPELPEILAESTQAVLDEVKSLERLVSEFSEFARLPSPKKVEISAQDLLDHTARLYGSDVGKTQVLISERARDPSLPKVDADRDLIGRALTNLVKNAVEAIGDRGGTVTLHAEPSARSADSGERGVLLLVTDDGPGMSEETRKQIFTPYFTTKADGTGLGLSIVERVIADHDGTIEVQSQLGQGTTFRIWLPSRTKA